MVTELKEKSYSSKASNALPQLPKSAVIKVDGQICLECLECELTCSLYHEGVCSPSLSRIHVIFDDFLPEFPTHDVCIQCDWPACYYACVSHHKEPAMYIDLKTGARVIDETKCVGCGACATSCPLMPERRIISYKMVNGRKTYLKCDLCRNRENGPICVEACPPKAITLVPAEARNRIHVEKLNIGTH